MEAKALIDFQYERALHILAEHKEGHLKLHPVFLNEK